MNTSLKIPRGYCQCGCGATTSINVQTVRSDGYVKGDPYRFLPGHNAPMRGRRKGNRIENRGDHAVIFDMHGFEIIIDVADVDLASAYTWYAQKGKYTRHAVTAIGPSKKRSLLGLHVLLMKPDKGQPVDHADGDGLNNRRSNLRLCTLTENNANQRLRTDNTTGYKGVFHRKDTGKWAAYISYQNKRHCLGCYSTAEEAAVAYNKKAIILFGEFARLNHLHSSAE